MSAAELVPHRIEVKVWAAVTDGRIACVSSTDPVINDARFKKNQEYDVVYSLEGASEFEWSIERVFILDPDRQIKGKPRIDGLKVILTHRNTEESWTNVLFRINAVPRGVQGSGVRHGGSYDPEVLNVPG